MATSKLVSPPIGLISTKWPLGVDGVYIGKFRRGFRKMRIRSGEWRCGNGYDWKWGRREEKAI